MGEQNKNIFTDTTINGVPVGLYKETLKELERRRSVLEEDRLNYQPILDELNKSVFEMEKLLISHKTLVEQEEEGSPTAKVEELLRSHREIVERSDKQKGKSNEIKLTEAEARLIQHAADAFCFINQEMSRCP